MVLWAREKMVVQLPVGCRLHKTVTQISVSKSEIVIKHMNIYLRVNLMVPVRRRSNRRKIFRVVRSCKTLMRISIKKLKVMTKSIIIEHVFKLGMIIQQIVLTNSPDDSSLTQSSIEKGVPPRACITDTNESQG